MDTNSFSDMFLRSGFGFYPNNEVLIKHYLMPKIMGINDSEVDNYIPTIHNLCNLNPSELQSLCWKPWNIEHCYFFCTWNQYGRGKRCDRKTKTGHWKKTGKDLIITDSDTDKSIGKRSILVFYEGRNPCVKTDYIMHVYELSDGISRQSGVYVICRLEVDASKIKKANKMKIDTPTTPISNIDTDTTATVTSDLEFQGEPASAIPRDDNENLGDWNLEWFSKSQDSSFVNTPSSDVGHYSTQEARAGFEMCGSGPVYSPESLYYDPDKISVEVLINGMFYNPGSIDDIF